MSGQQFDSAGYPIPGTSDEEMAKSLRERICMALIASPNCMADVIPIVAPAIEAYIIGEQEATQLDPAQTKVMSMSDMAEALGALVESGLNVKAQGVTFVPEGMKTYQDPFGQCAAFVVKFKAKP